MCMCVCERNYNKCTLQGYIEPRYDDECVEAFNSCCRIEKEAERRKSKLGPLLKLGISALKRSVVMVWDLCVLKEILVNTKSLHKSTPTHTCTYTVLDRQEETMRLGAYKTIKN